MDFRDLQLFCHLAGSLHFGKTAQACHVSPPTLSRVIQRIELACGAKVFVRNNGATKGTKDRYWYSPNEKYKLRSMVQVKKFLKALAENKGDEKKAKAAIGRL